MSGSNSTSDSPPSPGPLPQRSPDDDLRAAQLAISEVLREAEAEKRRVALDAARRAAPAYERRAAAAASVDPHFWLRALLGHRALRQRVSATDRRVLRAIAAIEVELADDGAFLVRLRFRRPNRYLTDASCVLEQALAPSADGTLAVERTARVERRRSAQPTAGGKRARLAEDDDADSLLRCFEESDTSVALLIKDELFPDPVRYFDVGRREFIEDDSDEESDDESEPEPPAQAPHTHTHTHTPAQAQAQAQDAVATACIEAAGTALDDAEPDAFAFGALAADAGGAWRLDDPLPLVASSANLQDYAAFLD